MKTESTRDCLDAETLAAWADDALSARERADVETHAASCARCQAMMAAMVRTAPAPAVEVSSPLKTRVLWWMAAFAPVAAAVVVWFAVPNREPVHQSQSVDAIAEQPAPAAPASELSRAEPRAQAPAPPQDESRNGAKAKELDAAPAEQSRRDQKVLSAPARASSVAETQPSAAASAPSPSPDVARSQDSLRVLAPSSAFASPDAVIVSSNPSTRFRLLTGGGVQRSADGGATWRNEVTGATETLIAGASPSPSVCWLIGRSGIVLLSTDGRSWRRVASPGAVDLRSVTATDHENATVTTVDGRMFVTADGGQTWARPPDF